MVPLNIYIKGVLVRLLKRNPVSVNVKNKFDDIPHLINIHIYMRNGTIELTKIIKYDLSVTIFWN